jgi:hypothetical protein
LDPDNFDPIKKELEHHYKHGILIDTERFYEKHIFDLIRDEADVDEPIKEEYKAIYSPTNSNSQRQESSVGSFLTILFRCWMITQEV